MLLCFFQAEDGIRDLVRSRGLGDVYKRQDMTAMGRLAESYARTNDLIEAARWYSKIDEIPQHLSLIHI